MPASRAASAYDLNLGAPIAPNVLSRTISFLNSAGATDENNGFVSPASRSSLNNHTSSLNIEGMGPEVEDGEDLTGGVFVGLPWQEPHSDIHPSPFFAPLTETTPAETAIAIYSLNFVTPTDW